MKFEKASPYFHALNDSFSFIIIAVPVFNLGAESPFFISLNKFLNALAKGFGLLFTSNKPKEYSPSPNSVYSLDISC